MTERIDLVGPKTAPVVIPGDDYRRLQMSERLSLLERLPVLSHVDDFVLDALGIEHPVGGITLNASGLRQNFYHAQEGLSSFSGPTSLSPMSENWLPVVGLEGAYEVSDRGRVRSLAREVGGRAGSTRTLKGRIISATVNHYGYLKVSLHAEGVRKTVLVHRLVCRSFHGVPPPGKELALHGNGNKKDNRASNLRWGSSADNAADSISHGTHPCLRGPWDFCKRGHPFDEGNTYIPPSGKKYCRKCRVIRDGKRTN